MTDEELIRHLNANAPPASHTLGGKVVACDRDLRTASLEFSANGEMCNPNDVVQGGFVCGMLDAAMANALFCHFGEVKGFATLEIKVSYLDAAHPGKLIARGKLRKLGKSIAFLEAELADADGKLLATANSTAKLGKRRSAE